jgi:L-amino acid N-acyltransferase YncA
LNRDLQIREVRVEDAEAIVGILNSIIAAGIYTVLLTPLTVEFEREYIASFPAHGVFLVAEQGGRVVGLESLEPFATYTPAFAHVGVIGTFVELAERHTGIGTALSQAVAAAARQKGYEKIFTYVRADNEAALSFHLRLGYRIIGRAQRQAKIGSTYVDEILIERFL